MKQLLPIFIVLILFAQGVHANTNAPLSFNPGESTDFWVDLPQSCGDGLVTNNNTIFGAEIGKTVIADPSFDFCGSLRPPQYNTSLNWTSNFTGLAYFQGWVQHAGDIFTAAPYNFTIIVNDTQRFTQTDNDYDNHTFNVSINLTTGDYVVMVVSALNGMGTDNPYLNISARLVQAAIPNAIITDVARDFTKVRNLSQGSWHYDGKYANVSRPHWSDNTTNNTAAGALTLFSVFWVGSEGNPGNLANFTFEHDNGNGTLYNESIIDVLGEASDALYSNYSYFVNSTTGALIRWRFYAQDSVGNTNVTFLFSYLTTPGTDTSPPQWSLNQTNTTLAGNFTLFSVFWTDDFGLVNFTFEHDNGNGTLYNESLSTFTGLANWSNYTFVVNSSPNSLIRWRVYARDGLGNINATSIFSYLTTNPTDVTPPQWSLNQTNTTSSGNVTLFSVFWTDNVQLSNWTFEHDNGNGTLYNETSVNFSGTGNWSNYTFTVNSTTNSLIRWRVYARDNSSKINVTSLFTYSTTSTIVAPFFGTGTLNHSVYDDYVSPTQGAFTNATNQLGQIYYGSTNGSGGFFDTTISSCSTSKTATYGRASSSSNGAACTFVWISNSYGVITISGSLSTIAGTVVARLQKWNSSGVFTIFQTGSTTPTSFINQTTINPGDIFRIYTTGITAGEGFNADNITYNGSPNYGYVFVRAYDEQTLAPKTFNLTLSNGTNTTTYQSTGFTFFRNYSDLPNGIVTFTVTNASCLTGNVIPRMQTTTVTGGSVQDLNKTFYLLCDGSNPVLETIRVVDQNQFSVPGATVNISLNGQTINVLTTDSTGLVTFYLNLGTSYQYVVTKTGYGSASGTLTASNQIITITITATSTVPVYNGTLTNVNWALYPDFLPYPLFNISASVNGSNLTNYGLIVTLSNGTILFSATFTNSSGSTLFGTPLINRTGWNGTMNATLFIQVGGFPYWSYTRTYTLGIYNDTNSSLTTIINNLAAANIPPSMKLVFALFASLLFAAGGGFVAGVAGAGIAFLSAFSFFAVGLGFVEYNFYLFIVVLTLAVYAFTKGF